MAIRVVIDAGHGGSDPGAVNKKLGLKEAELTLAMGQALSSILKARGYDVRNTRQDSKALDVNKSKDLSLRAKIANDWAADYFVSIHYNASGTGKATGAEVFCYKSPCGFAETVGLTIAKRFPSMVYRKSTSGNYAKSGDYAVLRQTKMKAVLIECTFIDNDTDVLWFLDAGNVKKFAEAIADGIKAYNA